MRDFLLIYVNGRRHELRGPMALAPLSTFLRETLGLKGTKVVCAEGDCGACAILAGHSEGQFMHYRAVTSCVAFAHQFDRTHVVTVEGLKYGHALNPVQQAMVECHGAQCGYCTPGFVVAMCGVFERDPAADPAAVRAALVGNLCRCTGYESILAAARTVEAADVRPLNALYPPAPVLADFARHADDDVLIETATHKWHRPTSLAAATRFLTENPNATVIAGATDVGVQVNKGLRDYPAMVTLAGVPGLDRIDVDDGHVTVGANVTLARLEAWSRDAYPELHPMLARHGSPLIRNAGTLAGNLANASSIGDAIPALAVLNAEVELTGRAGARRVDVNDFYAGYKQTVMTAGELITAVRVPRLGRGELLRTYKVSKRRDLDISTFTAAVWARVNANNLRAVRIAYGGVGPTVVRLPKAERFLCGRAMSESTFDQAGRIARAEVAPIGDVRGSAEYRAQLAENILRKFWHDVRSGEAAVDG